MEENKINPTGFCQYRKTAIMGEVSIPARSSGRADRKL